MATHEEYKIEATGETISVSVSTYNEFQKCIEDIASPFKHGETQLDPKRDFTKHKVIIVKCFIEEDQRTQIAKQKELSGEAICHEVVGKFIKKMFGGKDAIQSETINCSHYEQQYKYLVG